MSMHWACSPMNWWPEFYRTRWIALIRKRPRARWHKHHRKRSPAPSRGSRQIRRAALICGLPRVKRDCAATDGWYVEISRASSKKHLQRNPSVVTRRCRHSPMISLDGSAARRCASPRIALATGSANSCNAIESRWRSRALRSCCWSRAWAACCGSRGELCVRPSGQPR